MKRILYCTCDALAFENASRKINNSQITLFMHPILDSPTALTSIQDIAKEKVEKAYQKVKEPCFVTVDCFLIHQLNDFPGYQIRYILDTIKIDGILKLMEEKTNRACTYRHCLAYHDGSEIHYFFHDETGTIATSMPGSHNTNTIEQIFIPTQYQMSLETPIGFPKINMSCYDQFQKYILNHLYILLDKQEQN